MDRYLLAAAGAALVLALAGPAAAKGVHHTAKSAPAADRCTVPARADALSAPFAGDRALEAKIEQLTGVISALSDRLASLEEKLGSAGDGDGDADQDDDAASDDGLDLAKARGAHRPALPHSSSRGHATAEGAPVV
jgi:hypothetical protein